ncbi:MAG: urease accessory protein UreE, partial [Pseudomonadota bacterium]
MRKILHKTSPLAKATVTVTLEHSERQKSRGLLRLDDGTEGALLLERGTGGVQPGDKLLMDDGAVVLVQAALEGLSIVTAQDPLDLARAAYHLGNRHIAVQITALRLAYQHDHVLDGMLRELGFQVAFAHAAFEPESGAYGHGHAHLQHPRVDAQGSESGHG